MATKLQELLDELKGLKRFYGEVDEDGDFDLRESSRGDLIRNFELETLIAKYTETTPTYKRGDSVRVISKLSDIFNTEAILGFAIGDTGWEILSPKGLYYLKEDEFEPIN